MSLQDFIRLEAKALDIVKAKDGTMVWRAVECGAMEKVRLFAEYRNYEVTLNEMVEIIWIELCVFYRPGYRWN